MPRSKRETMIEESKLASREELEGLDRSALLVQKEKRMRLLEQMVGDLYPSIVSDEIDRINELLHHISHRDFGVDP